MNEESNNRVLGDHKCGRLCLANGYSFSLKNSEIRPLLFMSTIPSNDKLGPDGCLIQDIIIQIHEYSIIIIFCLENARKEYIVCMVAISIIAIYSPSLS